MAAQKVSAQQQTGQVAPQTRNPQTSTPELFNQEGSVQNTVDDKLLNQNKIIQIPPGRAAAPETNKPENSNSKYVWIASGTFTAAALLAFMLAGRTNTGKTKNINPESNTEAASPELKSEPDPKPETNNSKKPKLNKKSKKKRKRKRR